MKIINRERVKYYVRHRVEGKQQSAGPYDTLQEAEKWKQDIEKWVGTKRLSDIKIVEDE